MAIASSIVFGSVLTIRDRTTAQVVPDATLGSEASILSPNVSFKGTLIDQVEGGAIRGSSLFHSFQDFNVAQGRSVYFANPPGITNILSRVTGHTASQILGTLGVLGHANLFLLNPNGIVFGADARLDVTGSFLASTGDRFDLGNGVVFSATQPQVAPLLTINVIPGLQRNVVQPVGNLTQAANLAVAPGQSLTLFGKVVTQTGSLTAPGGTIAVLGDRIALLDSAQIDVSAPGGGGTVLIGGDFQGRGTVPPASRTLIAPNVVIAADAIGQGNGGKVIVWADDSTQFFGNISAQGGALGGHGGFVEVSGKQTLGYSGQVNTLAPNGAAGTLLLDPTNIDVVLLTFNFDLTTVDQFADPNLSAGGTQISAVAIAGATTNVILQATNDINFRVPVKMLTPGVGLTAQAGNNISFLSNFLVRGGLQTNGGDIVLQAGGTVLVDASTLRTDDLSGIRDSGDITITAGQLILQNIGQLGTLTRGIGKAGNINIQSNEITLSTPLGSVEPSLIASFSEGSGAAGTITIDAQRLTVQDGAHIEGGDVSITASQFVKLLNAGAIATSSFDLATGIPFSGATPGNVFISTPQLSLQNGSLISTSSNGASASGEVQIQATDFVTLSNSSISTQALTNAASGNLSIITHALSLDDFSSLGTSSIGTGRAGDVFIQASGPVTFLSSGILTNTVDAGNAGNITLQADSLLLQNDSQLAAFTLGAGNAGTVTVQANRIGIENSFVSVFSGNTGAVGHIVLKANDIEVKGQNTPLSSGLLATNIISSAVPQGTVTIDTQRLTVEDGAIVEGGDIAITATDLVQLLNNGTISTAFSSQVAPGSLSLQTDRLSLQGNSLILSSSGGLYNAGNLFIRATGGVDLTQSEISSDALGNGNAGNIHLETSSLLLNQGAAISAMTFGAGAGGNIDITASDRVSLALGSGILTAAQPNSTGNGGALTITTHQLTLQDLSFLITGGFGSGNAGSVTLKVSDLLELSNISFISADTVNSGDAGNISLTIGRLLMQNQSRISTSSLSTGTGGDMTIVATGDITLSNSNIGSISLGGRGGSLRLAADRLTLLAGSGITSDSLGALGGGDVTIQTRHSIFMDHGVIQTLSLNDATGGNIFLSVQNGDLILQNGSSIGSSAIGRGSSGNMMINVGGAIDLTTSILSTTAVSTGTSGNLSLTARSLSLRNNSLVSTTTLDPQSSTFNTSLFGLDATNPIDAQILTAINQAISSGKIGVSQGLSGNLTINVTDAVTLSGSDISNPSVLTTAATGRATAGNLSLNANSLDIRFGGISSQSQGQGFAGNLTLTLRDFLRSDAGFIAASSQESGGGDITLTASNILLRNSSLVSSSVFDSTGGGGNINIQSRAFIAIEDSDILANAEAGPGGNILIKSPAFLADLFASSKATAVGRNPGSFAPFRGNGRVDISADSRSGTSGTVEFPQLDLTRGLVPLAIDLVDPTDQISQRCQAPRSASAGSFVVTGRGGLPTDPTEPLTADSILAEWISLEPATTNTPSKTSQPTTVASSSPNAIVEAQGWRVDETGNVFLVSEADLATPHPPVLPIVTCLQKRDATSRSDFPSRDSRN